MLVAHAAQTARHRPSIAFRSQLSFRVLLLVGAVSAKRLIHPLRVLTVFTQRSPDSGYSDFLFGPNYIGIRGCFELNLSANMFYGAMIYFHFGAYRPYYFIVLTVILNIKRREKLRKALFSCRARIGGYDIL